MRPTPSSRPWTRSSGATFGSDRDTEGHSEHHATESAVLAAEIEQLPDRAGFLKIASQPAWMRVQFPVYALGPVPSTSVGHYRFAGADIPIVCDGVEVDPGDIIVADQDGVVVVPKAHAADILIRAQVLDNSEHSMYPFIEKYHSIVEAVQKFGRI